MYVTNRLGTVMLLVGLLLLSATAASGEDCTYNPNLPNCRSSADQSQMFVGRWYGERVESGQVAGKQFNHRRWLSVCQSDGTGRSVQRAYLDSTLQGEVIMDYRWGVESGIYWEICQSRVQNGKVLSCVDRREYEVQSITTREFRYRSKKNGIDYSVVRVPEAFRLP